MKTSQTISSKAPFFGAMVFMGALMWALFSPIFEGSVLRYVVMTIYGLVGLSLAAYGARLQMNGTKSIAVPGNRILVGLLVAVMVVVSLALMTMAL